MMSKIYLIAGIAFIAVLLGYGRVQYSNGYDKAVSEQNARIIELMRKNQEEKNKIQNKIKELQNAQTDCPIIDADRAGLLNE